MACADILSGTKLYMSLYPKDSTDGVLRLGTCCAGLLLRYYTREMAVVPQMEGGQVGCLVLASGVCTTEIASLQRKYQTLKKMDCLIATLSVDPVESHTNWIQDVIAQSEDEPISSIDFPIISDTNRDISTAYGMIDPWTSDRQDLPLTIRCVSIINPENKLMLSLNYPACVGRNMDEIVRCVKALQLSYQKPVATPANWPNNHAKVTLPNGKSTSEYRGSVFLLPTVTNDEADQHYPEHHTCKVPSKIPYLRLVKPVDVGQLPHDNKEGASCGAKQEMARVPTKKLSFSWFGANTKKSKDAVYA